MFMCLLQSNQSLMLQTNIKTLKRDHCDCVLAFKMMWEWWTEIHKFQDWLFSELHCWPTPTRSVKATANPILSAKYYHQQKLEYEKCCKIRWELYMKPMDYQKQVRSEFLRCLFISPKLHTLPESKEARPFSAPSCVHCNFHLSWVNYKK